MRSPLLPIASGAAVLAGAIAAAVAAAPSAPANPLRVGVMAAPAGATQVEITVTNTSRKTVRVPKWQLPFAAQESQLFQVSRDGRPVPYVGRLVKRGLPSPADFHVLGPGQSVRVVVDLATSYDLSQAGEYVVTYRAPLQHASLSDGAMLRQPNGMPMEARSVPLRLWVDARSAQAAAAKAGGNGKRPGSGSGTVVNGVSYVNCSATQIDTAGSAVVEARRYSEDSKSYLSAGRVGSRYTTWFGAYTSARYGTVSQHFVAIDGAMDQSGGQIKINCGCNQSYYAYVYPNRPYEIFVCRAFWSAPLTGTDSKAGTLIHEMSHFDNVANTDDIVYGQSGAKNLAASDPDGAVRNADNHEYFAENTPPLN
ncbi:MAG TPA: M35 family metallo-endopeptidase [Lysobacter sp.]|nr:M35 family metallo-endopeptidase [Lysobacter sp.]